MTSSVEKIYRVKVFLFILAIFLAAISIVWMNLPAHTAEEGCKAPHPVDAAKLAKFKGYIDSDDIGGVRVFGRPYTVITEQIYSDGFERRWETEVDQTRSMEYAKSLLEELTNTKICRHLMGRDLYWGIGFENRAGQRIFTVYMDRRYANATHVRGHIDGEGVEAPPTLLHWFESRFVPKQPTRPRPEDLRFLR